MRLAKHQGRRARGANARRWEPLAYLPPLLVAFECGHFSRTNVGKLAFVSACSLVSRAHAEQRAAGSVRTTCGALRPRARRIDSETGVGGVGCSLSVHGIGAAPQDDSQPRQAHRAKQKKQASARSPDSADPTGSPSSAGSADSLK
eukprot:300571-Chlamydomonas_euryale.AAC.14